MKKILLILLFIHQICIAQTFSFVHDGNTRYYIVHLPTGYNASNSYPMVLNFHGYTSNAIEQQAYSLMDMVADTAGFIVVYPEGIANAWNVGFFGNYYTGIDDIGFVNALIDTMIANYSIDANAVYATGMSNGGYLSNRLACELSGRIAAIASVTGPMTDSTNAYCNPSRMVPVMHIHGTMDLVVNYNGSANSLGAVELVGFWGQHDSCPVTSSDVPYPNINITDNCTAIRKNYLPCSDGAEVVLIEITNGGHTWPGAAIDVPSLGNTNRDFFASGEIWNFFRRFTLNQFIGIEQQENHWINIHPNPAFNDLYLSPGLEYSVFTMKGQMILEGISNNNPIDISHLKFGVYYVQMKTNKQVIIRKILKI